jgi:molecular chaperone GrpE
VTHQLQSALTDRRQALDEFEQVKSRLRRDTAKEVERGRRAVLVELLDVVDNLERALAAGRDAAAAGDPGGNDRVGGFARGVELVRDQFLAKLGSFGVQRVPAIGTPFDAARHDAVTTTPVDDAAMDGIIMAVIKDGYAVGDDVLRPAAVVVGRKN